LGAPKVISDLGSRIGLPVIDVFAHTTFLGGIADWAIVMPIDA
jgi:hypothetical protein